MEMEMEMEIEDERAATNPHFIQNLASNVRPDYYYYRQRLSALGPLVSFPLATR